MELDPSDMQVRSKREYVTRASADLESR